MESAVTPISIVPAPLVTVIAVPPVKVPIVGTPPPSPINNCPLVKTPELVTAFVPSPNRTPPAVILDTPVPPLATGNVPEVIAAASIAIEVLPAAVSLPWASTVKVATLEAEPYEPGDTVVLARFNVVDPPRATRPPPLKPVPAVTVRSSSARANAKVSAGDSVTLKSALAKSSTTAPVDWGAPSTDTPAKVSVTPPEPSATQVKSPVPSL